MNPIRFRSLSQIFALAVVFITVPLLVGTVLTFFYIERLSNDSRNLVVRSLEIGRESEKLIDHIEELNRTAQQYMVVRDQDLYNLYTQKHFRLIDILEWLELLVEKKEAMRILEDIRGVSAEAFEQIQRLSDVPEEKISTDVFDRLSGLSEDLSFFSNAAITNQLDKAAEKVETARWVLYWVWAISALLITAFIAVFALFIVRPVRRMESYIRRLGKGYFDDPIRISGPTDIAELGDRLDWLRKRLVEVDQIKERFFREMSHQLKTPLASIREGADLLMDRSGAGDLDATSRSEVLELLHNNSIELQRMLDNMLNFSAWRADPGKLYMQRFQLGELITGVVRRFQTVVLSRGLELREEYPDDLEVEMDREKCRVVLDNLLSNAIKYSPDKGVITIRVSRERSLLVMEVSDQGPGVSPELRDKVFELFYLGSGDGPSRARGTGVGLALVKAYVQAHGGNVSVEPNEDGGALFRVTIPQN